MKSMKSVTKVLCCLFAMLALTSLPICYGQDVSGMTGTVTDQSGAAVQGAVVTLRNASTGLNFTVTTGPTGFYRFSNIPPGQGYSATFTAQGFALFAVKDIYLTVAEIRTQNASLKVGQHAESVEVTASNSEVTIDTTSAVIGNTFDVQQLNSLPVQARSDPTALFSMQPGVTDQGAVTGARVDQNYVTLDGLDVNDISTGGATQSNTGGGGSGIQEGFGSGTIVGHAPVDSVEEFNGAVGGLGAATITASGGQFQLVTKSGTNKFHGNLNEYHRDPSLVANSWFNNDSTPVVPRNHLIQNQFGGAIGGPIILPKLFNGRDKLFFFFDFNDDRIVQQSSEERIVPLDSLRNGNIGYCTGTNCSGTNSQSAAQVKGFDPAGIGEDSAWVGNGSSTSCPSPSNTAALSSESFSCRFPHSNNNAAGDGINFGGYAFNAPANDYETNYVARIDYNLNQSMKIFGRFSIVRETAVEYPNQFAGDPLTDPIVDQSYAFVVGHTWVIGSNKTNRVFLGETVQKLSFPNDFNPDGSTFLTFGDGADSVAVPSSEYLNPNSQARRVPIPMVGDDFSWTKGSHTVQWGGTFKDILAHDTDVADYNTTEIGLGGQIFALCGPAKGDCGGANPSMRPADIDTSNPGNWDQTFAFMLGRIGNVQSDYNFNAAGAALTQLTGDQRMYRYYQTQLYVSDAWKVTPSLTLTYGLTYQYFSVPYETRGLESVEPMSFDQYMQARIEQSSLAQTGPTAVPLIAYYLGGKANGSNAQPLYKPEYKNMAPHVGFAWNPGFDKKSVLNGGVGIVYDRTIINSIQHLQDGYSYLFQQTKTTSEGITGDAYDSFATGPRLDKSNGISTVPLSSPATPKPPYQPFTAGGVPFGLQNGGAFNETIDPTLKTPYSISYNFGLQRQVPWDMVVKASYSGRLGRKLLGQADANQVLEFPDPVSGELLSTAFASITNQKRQKIATANIKPEPWFENVLASGLGASYGFASNTQFLYGSNLGGLVFNGDFGDFTQALSNLVNKTTQAQATPYNVGMGAQFSENSFHSNKGFSSYNGLLLTLQKNVSHGLQFDFNYTWSHSIDNVSLFASGQGDTGIGGGGLICDDIRPRECRASSDFDVRQIISGDGSYRLPFGKGKMFLSDVSSWEDEIFGGWAVSGVVSRHTGYPWQTASNAYVASYSNDAPAILVGNPALAKTHLTKLPGGGGVSMFPNAAQAAAQFTGPVGFTIGPRNQERGPGYFNTDLGLGKDFPIVGEGVRLKFRADAFNALNHPNFLTPTENVYNGYDQEDYQQGSQFGAVSFTANPNNNLNNGARVLQLALRLEF
jgi:carboxypeptidase family protein